jgi:hypothetical protein
VRLVGRFELQVALRFSLQPLDRTDADRADLPARRHIASSPTPYLRLHDENAIENALSA